MCTFGSQVETIKNDFIYATARVAIATSETDIFFFLLQAIPSLEKRLTMKVKMNRSPEYDLLKFIWASLSTR
jgi:hypothetical protein